MRSRLISLNQIVELEAQRLGLAKWEVVSILETALEKRYLRQNRIVHIRINPDSNEEPLVGLECHETLSGVVWEQMADIRPPHADVLQREVEEYVKHKSAERNWWLVLSEIIETGDDYYLVEIAEADEPGLIGKHAVLPCNRLTKKSRTLSKGDHVWTALTQKSRARYDGAEAWMLVDTSYVASRTDSIFLKMLIKKYWHVPVECDITNDAGLVMLPQSSNLGSIIGPNGKFVEKLKEISGLNRIVITRSVEGKRPDLRLIHAIKQIVNIDGVQVRPPNANSEEWRLKVSTKDAPILIGAKGTNLRFISVLTGLRIKYFIRDGK